LHDTLPRSRWGSWGHVPVVRGRDRGISSRMKRRSESSPAIREPAAPPQGLPRGGAAMFIRFVTLRQHEHSHCLEGVFQAAYRLKEEGKLTGGEARRCEVLLRWFVRHLPVPGRFSRPRGKPARRQAICWLKADAAEHLGKLRELAALLERHGVLTRMLWTSR